MTTEPFYRVSLTYVKSKIPDSVLEQLKGEAKNILDNPNQYPKFNHRLAGVIEKEYLSIKSKIILEPYLIDLANEFHKYWNQWSDDSGNLPRWNIDNVWMNFQKKYEYNPLHNHTGNLSFVLWVQVPYELEDELSLPNCINSNTPANSLFQFVYTNLEGEIVVDKINVDKSYEGTIVIFPSSMYHMVYPFYTSDDHRISISGNLSKL